jgi:hypothetical protein
LRGSIRFIRTRRFRDAKENPLQALIAQDIGCSDPQHYYISLRKPSPADLVVANLLHSIMGHTINFDGESRRRAKEVENVGPDRVLRRNRSPPKRPARNACQRRTSGNVISAAIRGRV